MVLTCRQIWDRKTWIWDPSPTWEETGKRSGRCRREKERGERKGQQEAGREPVPEPGVIGVLPVRSPSYWRPRCLWMKAFRSWPRTRGPSGRRICSSLCRKAWSWEILSFKVLEDTKAFPPLCGQDGQAGPEHRYDGRDDALAFRVL